MAPTFRAMEEARYASATQVRRAGVPDTRITRSCKCGARLVRVSTAWIVAFVGEWTVAYRLVPQTSGPVVGEVRIYPTEPEQAPGEWSGELTGTGATVPAGGLSARQLHRIPLGAHLAQGTEAMLWIAREADRRAGGGVLEPQGILGRAGFKRPKRDSGPARRRGPGRPGRSIEAVARVAQQYTEALMRGSRRPVADVAAARGMSQAAVRDVLHRARTLQLLTTPGKRGAAGGLLTASARELLAGKVSTQTKQRKKR